MTFLDITAGSRVFVDANVFVFHFTRHPTFQAACQAMLERFARGEIIGLTSADVVSDVAHRLMTIEAASKFGWPLTGIAYRLQRHPAQVQALATYRQSIHEISNFGVQVVPVELSNVLAATSMSQQFGLLAGDALIVAVMQTHGVTNLASHDSDFDRVAGITRFGPV